MVVALVVLIALLPNLVNAYIESRTTSEEEYIPDGR